MYEISEHKMNMLLGLMDQNSRTYLVQKLKIELKRCKNNTQGKNLHK